MKKIFNKKGEMEVGLMVKILAAVILIIIIALMAYAAYLKISGGDDGGLLESTSGQISGMG